MRTVVWLSRLLALVIASAAVNAQESARFSDIGIDSNPGSTSGFRINPTIVPAKTAGQDVMFLDASGWLRRGTLAKGDLPSVVGYTDAAQTWSLLQTFTSGLTSNGNVTIGGANDLVLGAGGMRVASGAILLRNIADSANIASFGDSAIALNQNTAVTGNLSASGTLGVTGVSTFGDRVRLVAGSAGAPSLTGSDTDTGIYFPSANTLNVATGGAVRLSIDNAVATFAGDVAINGGDLTSSAAVLNINSGGQIVLQDTTRLDGVDLTSNGWASLTTGWGITASGSGDFRYLSADEMHVKSFVADLEQALAGGQIIAKSVALLDAAFTCPAAGGTATLTVRDLPSAANTRVFSASDWVMVRTFSRTDGDNDGATDLTVGDCVGQVTSYADGAGNQAWTFTRGSGGNAGTMAASTVVAVDALALDFGVSGNGYLEASAVDGAEQVNAPYYQVVTWSTSPVAANRTVRARFGKLTGITSTANEYGILAGTYAGTNGQYFRASNSAFELHGIDLTVWDGTTQAFLLRRNSGAPYFSMGSPAPSTFASGAGLWMGDNAGTYSFRVGDPAGQYFSVTPTQADFWITGTSMVRVANTGVRVGDATQSHLGIDLVGNLFVRGAGAVNRIVMGSGNGNVTIMDDDGSTPRVVVGASQSNLGSLSQSRLQVNYTGTSASNLQMYNQSNKQYFNLDDANGALLGDWYTVGGSYVQILPTYFQFCAAGVACTLSFDGSNGNITSTGNILLSTGGKLVSSGNFVLGGAEGLRLESWSGTSVSEPRSIAFYSAGALAGEIGRASNGAIHIRSRSSGSGTGIRLLLGAFSAGGIEPGLMLTHENPSGTTNVTNIVAQGAASVAGNHTVIRFAPLHGTLGGGGTATSYIGIAGNPWDHIYGSQFYSNGSAGFSGTTYQRHDSGTPYCQNNWSGGILISTNCT